MKRKVQ